jgi:hypothetical protein
LTQLIPLVNRSGEPFGAAGWSGAGELLALWCRGWPTAAWLPWLPPATRWLARIARTATMPSASTTVKAVVTLVPRSRLLLADLVILIIRA